MVNIDIPEEIPDHQTREYRGAYRECIIPKFEGFSEKSYREDLEDQIEQEHEHRRLINYCIYPFSRENPPGGFRFIRADPLEERDLPNFDFLLYDFDGHMILGEAKATLPKQVDRIINEVLEQREVAEAQKDYIVDEYVGEEISHTEYVIATFEQANNITRKIRTRGEEIITWRVDRHSDTLSVNDAMPESFPDDLDISSPDDALQELRLRTTHSIPSINGALDGDGSETATGTISVFPNSDPVDQLRVVTNAYQSDGRVTYINRSDMRRTIESGAMNYQSGRIDQITERVIEAGLDIRLLEEWDDERGDFKVVSRYTSREGIEQTIEKKWMSRQVEKKKDELREECLEYARRIAISQAKLEDFL